MKRLLRPLAAGAMAATLIPGAASAATSNNTCGNISYTGPGSNNTISCDNNSELHVSCHNNVDVVTVNGQSSGSGSATVKGNTSGGVAVSGNAGNTNIDTTNIDVSCAPAKTVSTTPSTPSQGGKGAVAGAKTSQAASLPNTGSNA